MPIKTDLAKEAETTSPQDVPLHSTIHPERFDMNRFSELQDDIDDEKESPWRIIMYVIIVVIVGIGLALLVRFLISNSDDSDGDTSETEQTDDIVEDQAVSVNLSRLSDSSAVQAPTGNDEFSVAEQTSFGSESSTVQNVSLNSIAYQTYETFSRMTFDFSPTLARNLPTTEIEYATNPGSIKMILNEDISVEEELQTTISVNEIVSTITYSASTNSFAITLTEDARYRLALNGTAVIIDLRTEDQIELVENQGVEESDTTNDETADTTDTTDTPPSGQNLTNDFSQNKQYVTNDITGDTISQDIFYYGDLVDYFEFAWGSEGSVGDAYIPNASAELVQENGNVYIDIKIENLATEAFSAFGITGTALTNAGIDFSGANFVRIDLVSFEGGTANYRMQIKNVANFKLLSEPTVDGGTQVISIQVQD